MFVLIRHFKRVNVPKFCDFILIVIYFYTLTGNLKAQEWPRETSGLRRPFFHVRLKRLYFIFQVIKDIERDFDQGKEMIKANQIGFSK